MRLLGENDGERRYVTAKSVACRYDTLERTRSGARVCFVLVGFEEQWSIWKALDVGINGPQAAALNSSQELEITIGLVQPGSKGLSQAYYPFFKLKVILSENHISLGVTF